VVLAWTRAGDEARRGGRLDAARDRYRKALAILPGDRGVLVSLAATELADGDRRRRRGRRQGLALRPTTSTPP
jgi:Flp pilus assembly protein TadD